MSAAAPALTPQAAPKPKAQPARWIREVLRTFTPNKGGLPSVVKVIVLTQIALFFTLWVFSPFALLPTLPEVWKAFVEQYNQGLAGDLAVSVYANLQAIGVACVLSLGLAYLTVLEALRPAIGFLCKLRFLSMIGLSFFFTVATHTQHELKISLLVFSISVFFLTGMKDVIESIPKEQYDLARTLRMGPWETVWEVVVLGQIDKAFDVLRQNAAIGWMMLTMIESMVRSEGGIGATLTTANKHFYLSAVLAIQIVILMTGLFQDWCIGAAKRLCCPYSTMGTERK